MMDAQAQTAVAITETGIVGIPTRVIAVEATAVAVVIDEKNGAEPVVTAQLDGSALFCF
jgi:hypothetical protein